MLDINGLQTVFVVCFVFVWLCFLCLWFVLCWVLDAHKINIDGTKLDENPFGHQGVPGPYTCTPGDKKHLDVEGLSLKKFQDLFPDSGSWAKRLAPRGENTIQALFKATEYTGDPLLFSMHACLFADSAVTGFATAELDEKLVVLRKGMQKYRQEHGQWPHPGVLVSKVLTKP